MVKKTAVTINEDGAKLRPYFYRWVENCSVVPGDVWALPKKHGKKHAPTEKCECPIQTIKITDMHTMQLVNSIKWCIRSAEVVLRADLFSTLGTSRAQLLSRSPQWCALLIEAKNRRLHIVDNFVWFDAAIAAILERIATTKHLQLRYTYLPMKRAPELVWSRLDESVPAVVDSPS